MALDAKNIKEEAEDCRLSLKGRENLCLQSASENLQNGGENLIPDSAGMNKCKKRGLPPEDVYDEDSASSEDEDDSDWEPCHDLTSIRTWFCVNCTMANGSGFFHCSRCGEHIDTSILKYGFFSSNFSPNLDTDALIQTNLDPNLHDSSTAVGYDERMMLHQEQDIESRFRLHEERPDRLRAISSSLAAAGIFPGRCYPIPAREITREELLKVHSPHHVKRVDDTSDTYTTYFTPDTYTNKHSAEAARLAAGLCADLTRAILSGRFKNGFALVRPPGHHAGVDDIMGFCLHNNAAVAACTALESGAKRVLILDWDVHHGNGTQQIFEKNKSVLYVSLHRHDGGTFFPCTGSEFEVGSDGAEGYCVNIPWNGGGVGDNDYLFAFHNIVLPIANEFAPDFTIISAGFDAARGDPLGHCDVTPAGYAKMTTMLSNLSGGRLLVILEGGYNLRSISTSATAVIRVLLNETMGCDPNDVVPSKSGVASILRVLEVQRNYWPSLQPILASIARELKMKKERGKKQVPAWWKWGRKRMLFYMLSER